ncbi:Trehalose 6-phosphate phosphatase [Gammaproteobacteria bacterium]
MRRLPGLLIEKKSQAIALHYRQNPARESDAWSLAEHAARELGTDFRLLAGKNVVEIVVADADKGKAIERFMAISPYVGRIPVFAGDDVTDESGFEVVNRMGGISIKVGEIPSPLARFRIGSTSELRAWLTAVATTLEGAPSSTIAATMLEEESL